MNNKIDECVSNEMSTVDDTLRDVLDAITPTLESKSVDIDEALDCILAESLSCPFDFPPWPASAMDGYAFHYSEEVNRQALVVIGKALAGHPFERSVKPGECVRITTGAPMPSGTNTVAMQEKCVLVDNQITFTDELTKSQNVRRIGSSLKAGQIILEKGVRLGPKELALLSSAGINKVEVFEPLTVAIFTTGDELIAPGQALEPGKVYDSNRLTIKTMCWRMGFKVIDLGLVQDDPEVIKKVMLNAADSADVLLTSGGVSVGEADHIKPVLEEIGELSIWKVAIKPGKPIAIGSIGNCRFFGLPGNPVSTVVTLNKLVKPALLKLSGENIIWPEQFTARCLDTLRKAPGRRDYQRGIATTDEQGQWQVRSTGPQGSGRIASVSDANCYIILEPDNTGVASGEQVMIELFDKTLS